MADQEQRNAAVEAETFLYAKGVTFGGVPMSVFVQITEQMAKYAAEQVAKQSLQFNDAIPAMKEAYQQGLKDGVAAERTRIGDELDTVNTLLCSPAPSVGYRKLIAIINQLRGNDNDGTK